MFGKKKEYEHQCCKCGRPLFGENGYVYSYCITCYRNELMDKENAKEIVSCDKCKHLIYREDAVKEGSRVVKDKVNYIYHGKSIESEVNWETKEVIQPVFYCPNCAPKKGKNDK